MSAATSDNIVSERNWVNLGRISGALKHRRLSVRCCKEEVVVGLLEKRLGSWISSFLVFRTSKVVMVGLLEKMVERVWQSSR